MNKDKALTLALEALEELNDTEQTYAAIDRGDAAIAAIKEALQCEWVGLTDDERAECWSSSAKQSAINIEAKLKEKNT